MKRTFIRTSLIVLLFALGCNEKSQKTDTEEQKSVEQINKNIVSGWNTWNNPSLLSHVKMPEGLNLQFKMRKKRGGPYWLDGAYVANPKYNFAAKIKPLEHAYDGSYTALNLEWEGVKAKVQTATEGNDIVLLYSPVEEQEESHILVLESGFLWNKPGTIVKQDSILIASYGGSDRVIRSIGLQTGRPLPLGQPHLTFNSNEEIAIYTGKVRTLDEIKQLLSKNKAAFKEKNSKYGPLQDVYEAFQSVVAWNLFYDAKNNRGISSVSRNWNEAWSGYIIFDWDTYFIALLASLDHKDLAYANVFAITNAITDSGFIPNVSATYVKSNDRSQPPVGSMTVKMIYDRFKEKWFLEEVFDELLQWNRWWETARDNQGYLSWGSNVHPTGMSGNTLQAAKWESGLDNSPMFDGATFNKETNMMDLASVGLMSLYIADCHYLAEIAQELGRVDEANELEKRAEKYTTKLQELWDDEMGLYRDKNLLTGEFTAHKSPTHFYPMLAEVPTQEQAERMVKEHLMNPAEFYGEYMIPSISRDNPGFKDNSYWRGRIWAPMNYLVYMGLRNYNLPEARTLLAKKSEALILKEWREKAHVHENYNADTGEGDDMRNSDSFYAWGGLLSYITLLENGYIKE